VRRATAFAIGLLLLCGRDVRADSPAITNAVNFLFSVQDPDGSFSANRGALTIRDTAEVVAALSTVASGADPHTQAAASFLRIAPVTTEDFQARVIGALRTDPLISTASSALLTAQLTDGGFALSTGFARSDVLDTALALLALGPELRQQPTALFNALASLTRSQLPDGGFGPDDGASDIPTTAQALRALAAYGDLFDLSVAILPAQGFLLAQQRGDGSFGGPRETALATLALIESGLDGSAAVISAIQALEGQQEANGGFGGGDPEVTALALRVLRFSLANLRLAGADVAFAPSTDVASGTIVSITVTVRNLGAQAAGPSTVRVIRGEQATGPVIGSAAVPAIAAGTASPVALTWNTSGITGTEILTIVVDADNQVLESHEDDNLQRYVLNLRAHQPLDLTLDANDIVFTPERPQAGQATTIAATVHNLGDDAAGGFDVRFYDGDPAFGAPVLGDVFVSGVPAQGSAVATLPPQSFVAPPHTITVVVNPTNTVVEARVDNNSAVKTLVIARNVDLVVSGDDVSFTPPGPVHVNGSTTIGVRLTNIGGEVFPAARVRLYLGDPSQGGAAIGDILYGDLAGGATATGTFTFTAGPTAANYVLYAVADPDQTVDELSERNNIGRAPLTVSGGPDAKMYSLVRGTGTVNEGELNEVDFVFGNAGDIDIPGCIIRYYDGDPAAGGKSLGQVTVPLPVSSPLGQPWVRTVVWQVLTLGMTPGPHTVFAVADPDNLIAESDETNNVGTVTFTVRPRHDAGIAFSDVVLSPASPEQGDKVTVQATVHDYASPNDFGNPFTERVQIYLGDPATGGQVLLDQIITLAPATAPAVTLSTTVDTTALLGPQKIVVLVDPQQLVTDGNRTNNRVDVPFTVNADTKPDLTIARSDLTTPVYISAESTVSIAAVVHNLRTVAATGVHVVFYEGDPATGGPVISDVVVDVPAKGQATATATLDTHGLIGDAAIFVRVDPNNLIPEADKTNNEAALPIEVRHIAASAPTNLTTPVSGADITATWTAGTLSPQRGSYLFRSGTALGTTGDVIGFATLSTTSNFPNRQPSFVRDGNVNTVWYPASTDPNPQFTIQLSRKEYVAQVSITWEITFPWTVEAWDGVQYNVVASGPTAARFSTTTIPLNPPVKTRKLRISAGQSGLAEIHVLAVTPTAATSFVDPGLPAASYTYTATAVDPDGIETMPASSDATVAPPDPPGNLSASVSGNNVTLSWTASASATSLGSVVRRDNIVVSPATQITPQASMFDSSEAGGNFAGSLANDNNITTFWQPVSTDTAPFLEARFTARRLVSRVDVGWNRSGNDARDFDIQTWDGSQYVSQVQVRNHAVPLDGTFERYDLQGGFLTDRVRLLILSINGPTLQVGELDVYEPSPIAPATTTFVDSGRRTGTYSYAVTSINTFHQEGAPSTVSATVTPPSAPTNLAAAPSGNNVALSWTNGPEPNLAGVYVWRDGRILNAPSTNNIAPRGVVTITGNVNGAKLTDGAGFPGLFLPNLNTGLTFELVLPRSELLREIKLDMSSSSVWNYQIQTFDGTQYVTQARVVNGFTSAANDIVLGNAVRTTRVRYVFPPQNSSGISLFELRVFGPAPIAGSAFTDAAPPEGTHSYQVSAVSLLDDEGDRSLPTTIKTGTVEPPTNLAATLSGRNVQLTWTRSPEPNVSGYRVYRDFGLISGATLIPASNPQFTDPTRPNGTYTYWVTAVDTAGGETSPSASVSVTIADGTAPALPSNLQAAPNNGFNILVSWTASPTPGVIGYNLYKEHATVPANGFTPSTATTYNDSFVRGQPAYTYEVTAVDSSGNESARTPAFVYTVATPSAPRNVSTTVSGTSVTVNHSGSTGTPDTLIYRYKRDGAYLLSSSKVFANAGSFTAPPALIGSGTSAGAITDELDGSYWVSQENAYPLVFEATSPNGQPVDRVRVLFHDPAHIASDFDVSLVTFGGLVTLAQIRGNTNLETIIQAPDPPPIGTLVRLTVLNGPAPAIALADFRINQAREGGPNPAFVDSNVPSGPHTYVVRGENRSGVFSPPSADTPGGVSGIDLAIAATDIHFSQTVVQVGDTIGISATAHNVGTQDVDTDLSLYAGDPAVGAPLIKTQTVHVPAGLSAEIFGTWTVTAGVLNVYAVVDRNNTIPEVVETNNKNFRGLPFDLPYHSLIYTPSGIFVWPYANNTHFLLRNQAGQNLSAPTGSRGQLISFTSLPAAGYTLSADQKFASAFGDPFNGGILPATGYYVIDQENRTYSTEFFFTGVMANTGQDRVIVFARDPNTVVTVSNSQTSALIAQATLQPGEHLRLTGTQNVPFHVTANNPVAVVNFGDVGYPVAATNGKYTGTHFYAYVGTNTGGSTTTDFNVLAYQDNTSYTIRDLTTGALVAQGTLNNNGIFSMVPTSPERYLEVTTSNTAGVTLRPYRVDSFGGTYEEGSPLQDKGGTLIGTDFLDTLQGINHGDHPSAVAMAYYDNTILTVAMVGSNPPLPPDQLRTVRYTMNAGDFLVYSPTIDVPISNVNSEPSISRCGGIDCPAILYRLNSTRPISSISGTLISGGLGAGGPAPLLFGAANAPDIEVLAANIHLNPAQMSVGQNVAISTQIENLGPASAQNFYVDVYDNPPEQGGRLLHEEFVTELVEGDQYLINANWVGEAGPHQITVIADSRNTVAEQDETNNRAFVLAQTPADLTIAASDLTLTPASVLSRQTATLTAVVHDIGGLPANAPVALYLGDPAAGGRELQRQNASVIVGGTAQVTFIVDPSTFGIGPQGLFVKVDPDNSVAESNESNNVASTTLTVNPPTLPDLTVTGVSAPASVSTSQDVTIQVSVDNFGMPTSGPVGLRLTDGATVIGNQTLTVTGPQTATFTWSGPRALGAHTLVATIDPDNVVAEQSESNNSAQTVIQATGSTTSLAVTTDHPSYAPGAVANITATPAGVPAGTTLTVEVHDSADALVATLLASGPPITASFPLAITGMLPGSYHATGRLVQSGAVIARADAPFQVTSDAALVASLASDHLSYAPDGTAQLIATIANPGTNDTLSNLTLTYTVVDGGGATIGTATASVDALPPGGRAQRVAAIPLLGHLPTTATAALVVTSGAATLASANTQFTITSDARVVGQVSAAPATVSPGDPVIVSRTLTAQGNLDASGNVVTSVLDSLSGATLFSLSEPTSLPPGATVSGAATIPTGALAGRPYIVTVELISGGGTRLFRGVAGFTVFVADTLPPIITITGVSDQQCAESVTPTISAVDPEGDAFTLVTTLDGAPFTSGTAVTAEGRHTLLATATDNFGHSSQKSITFTIDATAPILTVAGVSDGQIANTQVTPTFSATDANLTSLTATLDGSPFTSGTAVTGEGTHALVVTAEDCAGNRATQTDHFTIDTTPPVIVISGVTDGSCRGAAVTPTFTVTDANPGTVSATLDGVAFASGTPVASEGTHTLVVTATDAAGNTSTSSTTFIVDLAAPAVVVNGVFDGELTNSPVTPVVTISDANLTSQLVTLDGTPFSGGTVAAEGEHLLTATASDCAGHTTRVNVAFSIDRTPPAIAVSGVTNNQCTAQAPTPTVTVTDAHPATQTVALDGAPFASGTAVTAQGTHLLVVSATDAAGNSSTQSVSFIVDQQAPSIAVAGVIDGQFSNVPVTLTVSISDANLTSSAIALDGAPFTSGTTVTAEGAHVLTADATDCAGNHASAHVSFTIDLTAPVITISGVNDGSCNGAAVTPTFSASDAHPLQLEATLDGAPFVSGTAVTADGAHTLVVTAMDRAGNTAQVTRSFVVDQAPPVVTVTGVSSGLVTATNVTPVVTFSDANLTSQSLTLDGALFVSGTTVSAEGDHVLVASAADCAGHTTTQTIHFAIDRTAPTVSIAGVSANQCASATIIATITISDAHLTSQVVTLDGAPYLSGTPISSEGAHEIAVTAIDAAGNRTDRAVAFIIDTTPPAVSVSGVVDGSFVNTNVTPTVTISDANLTASSLTLDGAAFASGTTVSTEGTHLLHAEAQDCAGNTTSRNVTFTIDKTAPVVTLSGVSDGQCTSANVTLSASYSDANLASTSLTLDGSAFASGGTVSSEGHHQAVASATDRAGNSSAKQASFTIDKTAPAISIAGVSDGLLTNQTVTPSFSVSDANLTSQSATLDGAAFISGTPVAPEGDHTLVVSGTDCAGNVNTRTIHFSIDKTAPVITITGVVDGGTYTTPVTPLFSASDAHLTSVSATLDGAPFVSGTTVSANGAHTLVVTAQDGAGNQSQSTVHFAINNQLATCDTNRNGKARILVAIESTNPPAVQPTFLIQTLQNAGYSVVVLEGRSAWLNALRSDQYGIAILYRTMSFNLDDYKEVNEAVTYGNGIIYIGDQPNLDPMQEAWGATLGGELNAIGPVTPSSPLGTAQIATQGEGGKLTLLGTATTCGTTTSSGHSYPIATARGLGLGHSVLMAWDAELQTSSALATTYLDAVTYVAPTPSDLVPGGAAEFNVDFASTGGSSGPFVVTLSLDPSLSLLAAFPSLTSTPPPTWRFNLASGQSEQLDAILRLPDASGTFPVTATAQLDTGSGLQTITTSSFNLLVPRSRSQLMSDVKAELSALSLTGGQAGLVNDALNHLNQVPDLTNPTVNQALSAIAQILTAIKDTTQITQVDVTSIRIDEARLLRAWETRAAQ
jgi:subtilase family serine protease